MNYHESLRTKCKHEPYRPVILHGEIAQWRCSCGKIVAAPSNTAKPVAKSQKS